MSNKIVSLKEAVATIPNGAHISLGGFTTQRHPMAFVHELIRQKKRNLHFYGHSPGGDLDMLIGAGCVRRVELAYEADEAFATIGPRFRNAIEQGMIEWEDYSNFGMVQRFAAGAMGIPFIPTRTLLGSDMLKKEGFSQEIRSSDPKIASKKFSSIDCPFTGDKVVLLPAIQTDVTIIHVQVVDTQGTVRIYGQLFGDEQQAKCAKRLIITCEEIVDPEILREQPEHNSIPFFRVDAIVKIPYGAHPYACYRYYDYDPEFLHVYHEKAKSRDTFTAFLDEYVLGVDNWEEYLEKIGGTKKLKKLKANRKLGYNPSLRRRQKKLKKVYAEDYTLFELMTVVSAQEIKDKEIVFAGTGVPMLGAMLAQHTHAPNCVIVFEAGAVDCKLAHLPMSVGDPRTMRLASTATGLFDVFSTVLQNGWIDVGFLSGAQIDKFGNINATAIGDYLHPTVRFTGSGGSGDIACLSKRTVIIARHEKRRFPERVDYITSPGWIDGPDGRGREGLRWGGPSAVVTTMGVLRFSDDTKTAYLSSYHPKISPQSIQENTGFELDISHTAETEKPTEEEIHILRNVVDPERIFLR